MWWLCPAVIASIPPEFYLAKKPMTTKENTMLLGAIPIVRASENIPANDQDGWEIMTDPNLKLGEALYEDLIQSLLTADVQYRVFKLGEHKAPPVNAIKLESEVPLRFATQDSDPIEPDVEQRVTAGVIAIINPAWLDAPLEAELFAVFGNDGPPTYSLIRMEGRIARKFRPNGATFFVVIKERQPE